MVAPKKSTDSKEQADKFRNAARELGCDEDEARFDERLKQIARQKPKDDPPAAPKASKTKKPAD